MGTLLTGRRPWRYIVPVDTFSRETLEPWYVTGLVEVAGAFTYSRSGKQLALYFGVKAASDQEVLLEGLRSFFGGAGKIYRIRAAGGRESAYYRVCRRDELDRVIAHFDAFPLRGPRAGSYQVWREMVGLKQEFRKVDKARLEELAGRLSAGRARGHH